jgi:hypothetical protein
MEEEDQARAAPLLQQPLPLGDFVDDEVGGGAATTKAAGRAAVEWWVESKKLWHIVGPAIFQRIALYGVNVVSQAFIGHLGDLELAAFSIAATVVAGFNFGFLVSARRHHPLVLPPNNMRTHNAVRCTHSYVLPYANVSIRSWTMLEEGRSRQANCYPYPAVSVNCLITS